MTIRPHVIPETLTDLRVNCKMIGVAPGRANWDRLGSSTLRPGGFFRAPGMERTLERVSRELEPNLAIVVNTVEELRAAWRYASYSSGPRS